MNHAANQLHEELSLILFSISTLLPAAAELQPSDARCQMLVAQLEQDDDDRLSAQTAVDIMCALWPNCQPEDADQADWWRTDLGRLLARALGRGDSESVTHAVAAAMLGVPRHNIGQMVARGQLDRHPDGGVVRSSVLQRLARA